MDAIASIYNEVAMQPRQGLDAEAFMDAIASIYNEVAIHPGRILMHK